MFRPTTHRVQSKVGGSFGLNIVTELIHKRLNCRIVKCHPRDTLEISKQDIYLHYLAPALLVMLFLMYWLCSRLSTTCSPMMGPGSEELQMVAAVPDMFELKE